MLFKALTFLRTRWSKCWKQIPTEFNPSYNFLISSLLNVLEVEIMNLERSSCLANNTYLPPILKIKIKCLSIKKQETNSLMHFMVDADNTTPTVSNWATFKHYTYLLKLQPEEWKVRTIFSTLQGPILLTKHRFENRRKKKITCFVNCEETGILKLHWGSFIPRQTSTS